MRFITDWRRPILGSGPGQLEVQVRDQGVEGGDEVVGQGHCFSDYDILSSYVLVHEHRVPHPRQFVSLTCPPRKNTNVEFVSRKGGHRGVGYRAHLRAK